MARDRLRAALLRLVGSAPEFRTNLGSFGAAASCSTGSACEQPARLQEVEYLAAIEQRVAPVVTMAALPGLAPPRGHED